MIEDVIRELNESKTKRKIYTFETPLQARKTRVNWFRQLQKRELERKVVMEQSENLIAVELIGVDQIPEKDFILTPEKKTEPDRGAFLDKAATKELPGTMELLRQEANEASRLHMTYGQYKAQKYMDFNKKYGY